MRQVLLDTETTGLDPLTGDRVIEVAAIELLNLMPTGRQYHALHDPEREVPPEAARIHGMTTAMLRGKPRFAEGLPALLAFLGDDPVIAHNAPFDFGFLDAEFRRAGAPPLDRARMVDTLALAKRRYPGLPNNLDALCRRLGVDNSMRTSHNALLDVTLLAEVYLELMGGRQPGLGLGPAARPGAAPVPGAPPAPARTPRLVPVSAAERQAHVALVTRLKDPLWPGLPSEP